MLETWQVAPVFAADHSAMVVAAVLVLGAVGALAGLLVWPASRRATRSRRDP